jgi:hypothetical protein
MKNKPTIRKNMSSLSSGPKNRPRKEPEIKWQAEQFDPEDGGDMFLRNID